MPKQQIEPQPAAVKKPAASTKGKRYPSTSADTDERKSPQLTEREVTAAAEIKRKGECDALCKSTMATKSASEISYFPEKVFSNGGDIDP